MQIKHIRGILFEEENVRKSTTKKDQTEVKKKTSQKKRSDKPVVEQNSDIGDGPVIDESETKSVEDSESNAIVIISDEDTDVDKPNNEIVKSPISNPTPSTSKNLLSSGKSFMGSSKTPIKPSQTVVRAEATSSGIKSKKESSLDKAYLCGRCCKYSDHTIALVRAHQATAHPNVVCEVFMRNTNNEAQQNKSTTKHLPDETVVCSKPAFSGSINFVCYHCIFKSQNPTIIYKHWKENHKFPKITTKNIEFPSRPFMFRILKIFQCCYCRRCSHYKDLKIHIQRSHPFQTFAMIDNLNPKKCALCLHEFNADTDVIDHFKESHKNLAIDNAIEPDNYLTDELVDEVVSVLPKEQVKCTQPNCNIIFFSMAELEGHTNEKHRGTQIQFDSIPNDPIMYGCISCQEINSSESAMVAHIRSHLLQFQCKFCEGEKRFNHLDMIKAHHKIMHNSTDETYLDIDVNEYLDKYSAMKIIFPNGFVLTKADAKRTKYGNMDDIIKWVTELNVKDLEVVRKRQEEKNEDLEVARKRQEENNEKPVTPLVIKKKNLKRLRISDSDSDDGESKESIKATVILRKKRKPNALPTTVSSKTSDSKLKVDSKIQSKAESKSSSDDNEPLQNLIPVPVPVPVTNRTQPVDLSKIFIDVPFGKGSIRITCECFAQSCKINPKLRLKRCTS